tara:strand:- start:1586 stop:1777 length:192 start_codon:yes stop_codon:yes gene_type:complete
MDNRFLKFDLQSILLVICTIISGAGLARYIEYKEISMLLTFIGLGLTSLALTADIYRKRKIQK